MPYFFTSSERALIQQALDQTDGLAYDELTGQYEYNKEGGNAVPVYQALYEILVIKSADDLISLSDMQDIKNATLWLSVAIEANGGSGVYSDIIKNYTVRQGELRLGRTFTDEEIQAASNVVARNLVNGLLHGSTTDGLEPWSVPTISQIAALDAAAIGEQLFKEPLGSTDTATSQNSAWSGTIGFSLLGGVSPYETWRLVSAGDPDSTEIGKHQTASVNRLDDLKNILYAVDSYRYASVQALVGTAASISQEELISRLAAFIPKQYAIALASGQVNTLIQYVVKDTEIASTVQSILNYGTDKFLSMMSSVYYGRHVEEGSNFTSDAYDFFSKITVEKSQNTVMKMVTDYDDWQKAAHSNTDAGLAIRNSLKFFSVIVIEDPVLLAGRGLDLYSDTDGTGTITDKWVDDRTAMYQRLLGKYNDISSDFTLQTFSYTDMDSQYQATMPTGTGNPLVIFGSDNGSIFGGASKGDHLYGGTANDTIDGMAGNDYIEGGGGTDILRGNAGSDDLMGMDGSDTLDGGTDDDNVVGGAGSDTYLFAIGDGNDVIYDSDHDGKLNISGTSSFTAYQTSPDSNVWLTTDAKLKLTLSAGLGDIFDLTIVYDGGQIRIKDFRQNTFGITLNDYKTTAGPALPSESSIIYGDLQAANLENPEFDNWGNLIADPNSFAPDSDDYIYDMPGGTTIYGLGGNDKIIGKNGGDDLYDGGSGHDYIVADSGEDTIIGGSDSDIIFSGADDDFLTGDTVMTIDASLKQTVSVDQRGDYIDGGDGDDTIIGSAANDRLYGGRGSDVISGGAGDDLITSGDAAENGQSGAERFLGAAGFNWRVDLQGGYATTYTMGWTDSYSSTVVLDDDPLSSDTVYGGAGDDAIFGGIGQDTLDGGGDNDFLRGGGGSDIIDGGIGNDKIFGEDYVEGGGAIHYGDDFLNGGEGDDAIVGGAGADRLFGGDGDDTLYGDYFESGALPDNLNGNDSISGGIGSDYIQGGGGDDSLYGDTGDDKLYGDFGQGPQGDDYLDGGAGDDIILGVGGVDRIYGGAGNDSINGDSSDLDPSLTGNDWIDAGDGDDYVLGGGGNDTIYGGIGNDSISGDDVGLDVAFQGSDFIDGGDGDDIIDGMGGNDTIFGGYGADKINAGDGENFITGGIGNDEIWAGAGNDVYDFGTGDGVDMVHDSGGKNKFYLAGTFTPDSVVVVQSLEGFLKISLGADTLYFDKYQALHDSSFYFGDGTTLTFAELMRLMETPLTISSGGEDPTIVGGAMTDNLTASSSDDTLVGNQGNDTLNGADGNDVYQFGAGDGDDTIIDSRLNSDGTAANNLVKFAAGIQASSLVFDVVYNGDGSQSLKVSYPSGSITIANGLFGSIAAFQFSDGTQLSFIDAVAALPGLQLVQSSALGGVMYGSNNADQLYGGIGVDALYGQGGNDEIYGGDNDDSLYGQSGRDVLDGGAGNDILDGGDGDDKLSGGAGDDLLQGGDGSDSLLGGAGNDILEGGEGSDTYVFHAGMQQDLVMDSSSAIDIIHIDSSVDLADLVTARQGTDLLIQNAGTNDALVIQGYYDNPLKWTVSDSNGVSLSVADFIAVLADRPTSGLEYYTHLFEKKLKTAFNQNMEESGFQLGTDGKYHLDWQWNSGYSYSSYKQTVALNIQAGAAVETPAEYPFSTTGPSILYESSFSSTYQHDQRAVGTVAIPMDGLSGTPIYYTAGTNFTYNLESTIIEKKDSEGNVQGYYVYEVPNAQVIYKTFAWQEDVRSYTYKVVTGGDGGERVNVMSGNQFYGGSGNDTIFGLSDYVFNTDLGVMESGGAGDDTIIGSKGTDTLAGGSGKNVLMGGYGADTYVIDTTAGTDVVSDFNTPWYYSGSEESPGRWHDAEGDSSTDVVALPDTATMENIVVGWGVTLAEGVNYSYITGAPMPEWATGRGTDALMLYTTLDISWGGGRTIHIVIPHSDQPSGDGIETIRFADGTEVSITDLANLFGLGIAPDPSISGAVIDTNGAISPVTGENLSIAGGAGPDTIRGSGILQGWAGDDSLTGGYGDDTLDAGRGDDVLLGGAGNDVIRGGAGNDFMDGGAGDDTYAYIDLEGSDKINSTGGGTDTVMVDDPYSLQFHREGDDLLIFDTGNFRNQIRVVGQFASDIPVITYIRNQYGDTLTAADIASSLSSTPINIYDNLASDSMFAWGANTSLFGAGGADMLTTVDGNTVMNGGSGDDFYTYIGGKAVVEDSQGDDSITIDNGTTIAEMQSRLSKSNDDLLIDFGNAAGDTLTVKDFFVSSTHQVELFQDAVGATLSVSDVYASLGLPFPVQNTDFDMVIQDASSLPGTLTGTDRNDLVQAFNGDDLLLGAGGNDRLEGGNGNDMLIGGAGSDTLIGGRGNDTYLFSQGDGQDTIDNRGGGDDTVVLEGVSIADFYQSFSQAGSDLVLQGAGEDSVTIKNWFSGGDPMVSSFELDDGSITAEQILQQHGATSPVGYTSPIYSDLPEERYFAAVSDESSTNSVTLLGSSSDDLLIAGQGDDFLDGGAGNDYLVGGNGNDVYVFGNRYGQDTINNSSNTTDDFDVLEIDERDVTKLWFSQSHDDLVVTLLGSDDQVTVKNWFSDASSQLGLIAVNEHQFGTDQVDNLVNAMASFGVPAGGDIALTHDQRASMDYMLGVGAASGGGGGGGMVS